MFSLKNRKINYKLLDLSHNTLDQVPSYFFNLISIPFTLQTISSSPIIYNYLHSWKSSDKPQCLLQISFPFFWTSLLHCFIILVFYTQLLPLRSLSRHWSEFSILLQYSVQQFIPLSTEYYINKGSPLLVSIFDLTVSIHLLW